MKFLILLLTFLILGSPVQAKMMSSCEHACFEKKYNCNIYKSHTHNTCHEELFECRLGCMNDKKPSGDTAGKFPLNVSFHPTLELGQQVLNGLGRRLHR